MSLLKERLYWIVSSAIAFQALRHKLKVGRSLNTGRSLKTGFANAEEVLEASKQRNAIRVAWNVSGLVHF